MFNFNTISVHHINQTTNTTVVAVTIISKAATLIREITTSRDITTITMRGTVTTTTIKEEIKMMKYSQEVFLFLD